MTPSRKPAITSANKIVMVEVRRVFSPLCGSQREFCPGVGPHNGLCPEVVAQQPRTRAPQQVACVLRDIQQPTTEYRESPGFARREQPRPRYLLVSLRRQLHPQQVPQLPETEEFFHSSACTETRFDDLRESERVSFDVGHVQKGHQQTLHPPPGPRQVPRGRSPRSWIIPVGDSYSDKRAPLTRGVDYTVAPNLKRHADLKRRLAPYLRWTVIHVQWTVALI